MKIHSLPILDQPPRAEEELLRWAQTFYQGVYDELLELRFLVNGNLTLENLGGVSVTVSDTGTADVEFNVTHTLGRIPTYYTWMLDPKSGQIPWNTSSSPNVYDSDKTNWTSTTVKLKCNVSNAQLIVYLL